MLLRDRNGNKAPMPVGSESSGPPLDLFPPTSAEAPEPTPDEHDPIARSRMIEFVAIGLGITSLARGSVAFLADLHTREASLAILSTVLWATAYALSRRGHLRSAAWILTIGAWATATSSALLVGDINTPQLATLGVVVPAAGLLIDRSSALTATFVASLTIAGLTAIHTLTPPTGTPFEHENFGRIVVLVTMLVGSVFIFLAMLRGISNSKKESTTFQLQLSLRNAELTLARERYREISDLTFDYFYSMLVTPDGTFFNETVSPQFERITGYTNAELTPELYWDIVHPDDKARVVEREKLSPLERPTISEHRILSKSGDTIWIRDHSKVSVNADGTTRLHGASKDITEEKRAAMERNQMELELQQAQKMDAVGRLAGGVAHDFNNLLTVITGFSEILAEEVDDEATAESVDQIRIAANRATELTSQLMAFSRRPLGDLDTVDINKVIRDLTPMFSRLLGEGIQVVTDLAPDTGHATGEPGLFEQVFVNLAVNARDAMPEGGALRFESRRIHNGDSVRIRVSDAGVGMSDEVANHVFEPFYTTKSRGEGTGLGLSTAYGIIQRFSGTIQVETSEGEGCTFEIVLPAAPPAPVGPNRSLVQKSASPLSPKMVLVVEDEDRVRQVLCTVLEAQGHHVLQANSGDAALQVAEASDRRIDLLVTDVVMPGMSGFELAHLLLERDSNLRVLIMSGYANQRDDSQLPAAASFLQKPFGPRELATELAAIYS